MADSGVAWRYHFKEVLAVNTQTKYNLISMVIIAALIGTGIFIGLSI
ncbi:hypothetical protein KI655_18660 [Vibrio sp. D404a]|nr:MULTISPECIES: hypothetical protein [unclassified Vibrio]MDK9739321.1 hypothetical protein [Vibrio sp. D404a]MDK9797644.1 hypothetical protein [Vibrio sp. D449a]